MTHRLSLPEPLYRSYEYYAADERLRIESPAIRELITPEALMRMILEEAARKMGHYPPKDKA